MFFWVAAILKCQIRQPYWESALAPGKFELSRLETISVQNFMLVDKFAQFSRPGIGKSVLLGGGHFEMSNTATPLRIGFDSRQIWTQQVKNYKCAKFHACSRMCTIFSPTDPTTVQITFRRWQGHIAASMLGHYHRRCHNVGTPLAKFSHRFANTVTWLDVPMPDGAVWLPARCD